MITISRSPVAREMAQKVKVLCTLMTRFTPEVHIKNLDVVSHICNSSTSARRWDTQMEY